MKVLNVGPKHCLAQGEVGLDREVRKPRRRVDRSVSCGGQMLQLPAKRCCRDDALIKISKCNPVPASPSRTQLP
jgi:hypothetical protein